MHECSTNTEEQCNGLVPPTRASYTCARGVFLTIAILDGQMGKARWAGTGTARKSPALARHDTKGIVPRAGPARWSDRAWAATLAR
jgi:hypothetical protein